MSNPWFRFYCEFAGDAVVQSLAFEDQRHYVILLCLKGDGTLDRPMDARVRDRIICRGLGLDPVTASEAKRRLLEVRMIDENWQPCGWNKRQYISDNSTPRVRKYRKTKETGNVPGTLQKRFGNGPDTDTDTDNPLTPLRGKFELPPSVDLDVWREFEEHRKEIRKPLTDRARAKNAGLLASMSKADQRAAVDTTIRNRWTGIFEPKQKASAPIAVFKGARV
jgi:hypothetical protein